MTNVRHEEKIDADWMSNSGLLQHVSSPSIEECRAAADSLRSYLNGVDGAEWEGGDRWSFENEDRAKSAVEGWLEALNESIDYHWPGLVDG